jgi:hypothetical protein
MRDGVVVPDHPFQCTRRYPVGVQDDLRPAPWWEGQPRWLYVPTTYHLTRFAILRLLGFVYFFAFVGLVPQAMPLIGSHGLEPAKDFLSTLAAAHEKGDPVPGGFWQLPTLFWFGAGDTTMQVYAWIGVVLSAVVMIGFANGPIMIALWILYGSFVRVGQTWFAFGWEIQILETGLIAAFLAPPLDPRPFPNDPPPLAAILLMRWLTFRIMLGAGLIKARGDACWSLSQLRCLDWHFETQPVPNPLSPLYHAAPHALHALGVLFNHLCELVLPWFVFGPRLARLIAGACMVTFQLILISSGNLAFLNWLTLVPILACFDDDFLVRLSLRLRAWFERVKPRFRDRPHLAHRIATWVFAAIVALLSLRVVENLADSKHQIMNGSFDRFDAVGTYGAFGSMNDERDELIIEGTADDDPARATWKAYELPCKPGDPMRRPCVLGPYHHRLDWLMWFAAMDWEKDAQTGAFVRSYPEGAPWLVHLVWKLLHDDPLARSLLAYDPFRDAPPRWIRIELYRYRFAPLMSDAWWTRERIATWLPPMSIDSEWLRSFLADHGWSTTYEPP